MNLYYIYYVNDSNNAYYLKKKCMAILTVLDLLSLNVNSS